MESSRLTIKQQYDLLWNSATKAFESGLVDIDDQLTSKDSDRRRGFTLVIRPNTDVQSSVKDFLDELHRVEPEQYYYQPSEMHVTLLSLFTATEDYEAYFAQYDRFARAVACALMNAREFEIDFQGITASPSAVMIQGFPKNDALESLRKAVRSQLKADGLDGGLDGRYRIRTAHMTVARFQTQLSDHTGLLQFFQKNRTRDFGKTAVRQIDFVDNDWYMSENKVRVLAEYRLK